MIKNMDQWQKWEEEYRRQQRPDFFRNLQIVEALFEEAQLLGVWKRENPLDGIETKIRLARALNVL